MLIQEQKLCMKVSVVPRCRCYRITFLPNMAIKKSVFVTFLLCFVRGLIDFTQCILYKWDGSDRQMEGRFSHVFVRYMFKLICKMLEYGFILHLHVNSIVIFMKKNKENRVKPTKTINWKYDTILINIKQYLRQKVICLKQIIVLKSHYYSAFL